MKKETLIDVIKHIPKFVAVFKVIKVPGWAECRINRGDEVTYNERAGCFMTDKNMLIALGSTNLEFVRYEARYELLTNNQITVY